MKNKKESPKKEIDKELFEDSDYEKDSKLIAINYMKIKSGKTVAFYTGYSPPFHGKNYKDQPVYGSEIAVIKLAESLYKLSYTPVVFCVTEEEMYHNGVYYLSISRYFSFISTHNIDYMIISRFIHFFLHFRSVARKGTYLWLHDTRANDAWEGKFMPDLGAHFTYNLLPLFNKVICVSPWHKETICSWGKYPEENFTIIGNASANEFDYDVSIKKEKIDLFSVLTQKEVLIFYLCVIKEFLTYINQK